jgi:hypothetical protein
MVSPRTDNNNFPHADPVEPHAGIAREGVDSPNELARREELPYDERRGLGMVSLFFGALLVVGLGLLFLGPKPSDTGTEASPPPPSTVPKVPN